MAYDRLLSIERVRERALRMPTEKPRPDSEMALRPREYEKILRESLGEPVPNESAILNDLIVIVLWTIVSYLFF